MIDVTLKFFAVAREIAGKEETVLTLESNSTVSSVLEVLVHRYPRFADWKKSLRVAVNFEYVSMEHVLSDRDEVAVIPPVSGG